MRGFVAAILGLFFPWHGAPAAEPVYLPGSRIGLVPPPGLMPAKDYPGFTNQEATVTFFFMELAPEEYASHAEDLTPEALKRDGMDLELREEFKLGRLHAVLVRGRDPEETPPTREWIMLVKDADVVARIATTVRDGQDSYPDELIEKALKSISLRGPRPMAEQIAALPFRIGDMAGFRPVEVIPMMGVQLEDDPKDVPDRVEDAIIVLSTGLDHPPPGPQRKRVPEAFLTDERRWSNARIERSRVFRRNGRDWYEGVSHGVKVTAGEVVLETFTIRYETDIAVGIRATFPGRVRPEQVSRYLERFRTVLDSVDLEP